MSRYEFRLLRTPLPADGHFGLEDLLRHKGEPWMTDIRWRVDHASQDLFAVACAGGRAVANCWLGRSARCPGVGLLGHVFTAPDHRRRGLAGRLLSMVLEEFSRTGGRWAILFTGNPGAARLYERAGFAGLIGGPWEGKFVMLRPADPAALRAEYARRPAHWTLEVLEREHYPSACLLLCAAEGDVKLPSCGVDRGTEAEERLLEAIDAQDRGEKRLYVMVEGGSGRVRAIACAAGGRIEYHAPGLGEDDVAAFQQAVAAARADGS